MAVDLDAKSGIESQTLSFVAFFKFRITYTLIQTSLLEVSLIFYILFFIQFLHYQVYLCFCVNGSFLFVPFKRSKFFLLAINPALTAIRTSSWSKFQENFDFIQPIRQNRLYKMELKNNKYLSLKNFRYKLIYILSSFWLKLCSISQCNWLSVDFNNWKDWEDDSDEDLSSFDKFSEVIELMTLRA